MTTQTPAPQHVAAHEHVEGLQVDRNRDSGTTVVTIGTPAGTPSCLATVGADGAEGRPADRIFQYASAGVVDLRVDRLLDAGSSPVLEERRAVVDARTLGAMQTDTWRVPLRPLARGPGGLATFAARVPEGVLVVVAGGGRTSFREGQGVSANNCTLHRFLLKESIDATEGDPKVPLGRSIRLVTMVEIDHKEAAGPFARGGAATKENRAVSVAVSLSRGTGERDPLLSVSIGFAGPGSNAPLPQSVFGMLE